jgi:hypothetical protein
VIDNRKEIAGGKANGNKTEKFNLKQLVPHQA